MKTKAGQLKIENAEVREMMEMKYPETDPAAYKAWTKEGWRDIILVELEKLLLFVRKHTISGLEVGKIRVASFTPFGRENMFNRRVWLLMNEIDAYQNRYKEPVNEEALAEEWKLSGLKRPWSKLDSAGKNWRDE